MSVGVEVVECWDRRSGGARFYLVREEDTRIHVKMGGVLCEGVRVTWIIRRWVV